jgi:hypothetical protein
MNLNNNYRGIRFTKKSVNKKSKSSKTVTIQIF